MTNRDDERAVVDQFLLEQIDTVPHLEALLLLWNRRPRAWSVDEMAKALFLTPDAARDLLDNLARQRLIVADSVTGNYRHQPDPQTDGLLALVDSAYRHELVRISRLIHSKPPAAVREFAKAFRLKKERE